LGREEIQLRRAGIHSCRSIDLPASHASGQVGRETGRSTSAQRPISPWHLYARRTADTQQIMRPTFCGATPFDVSVLLETADCGRKALGMLSSKRRAASTLLARAGVTGCVGTYQVLMLEILIVQVLTAQAGVWVRQGLMERPLRCAAAALHDHVRPLLRLHADHQRLVRQGDRCHQRTAPSSAASSQTRSSLRSGPSTGGIGISAIPSTVRSEASLLGYPSSPQPLCAGQLNGGLLVMLLVCAITVGAPGRISAATGSGP
jgi:hypothetical protein